MSSENLQTNMNSFHVHGVLDMLYQIKEALSAEEIKNKIAEKFGVNSSFCSCSSEGMNPDQVIEFLLQRQKIIETLPGKYQLNLYNTCNH
jgi:probable metal-binding protein